MGIVIGILLFSVLIFVHELGHFLAAKASGVQVNEFSIFMGPAIFKKQVGETLYSVRCIPFGGYCAMEGEDEESDNPRAFGRAAWWKRLIILVAGAAMNFLFGILLMAIVYGPSKQYEVPVIGEAMEGSTLFGEEGLRVGDEFLEVDGEKIYVANDVELILAVNPGETHDLVILRDGEKVRLDNFKMEKHEFVGKDGVAEELYGFRLSRRDATFGDKLEYIWNSSIDVVRTVRLSLEMLLTGKAGFQDMTGPAGIVDMVSQIATTSSSTRAAVINVLYFGAFLAINLAVMNLLPIPALDGGRVVGLLLTTGIEAVTKKKVNPKYEAYINGAGMILLLALMAAVTFKDIFTIFKR